MANVWFVLLAWMLATYVVLDGFDFGAGILHLFVAKSDAEREQVLRVVGPVWDGNEVWLIAAGGTMFMAFPVLLGTAFSGFYLPLMIVLWLLVFRALGIELRHQLHDPLWSAVWDVAFSIASFALAVCFGAAMANVVRGVPLNNEGVFFEPLWTDLRVGDATGILDWYTVLVGVTAAGALAHHGGLFLWARTEGAVADRAVRMVGRLWGPLGLLTVLITVATFSVQASTWSNLAARPWGVIFPVVAATGLIGSWFYRRRSQPWHAFVGSVAYLYGMIGSAAIGIYPYALPARDPALGLTIADAASSSQGLATALIWWIPGMLLVGVYSAYAYRDVRTKVPLAK